MNLQPLIPSGNAILVLDQTRLPHAEHTLRLASLEDCAIAIETMQVRGAPLIGATAAFGLALGLRDDPSDASLNLALARLGRTRPTAVNLHWALARMQRVLALDEPDLRAEHAWNEACAIHAEDIAANRAIGENGSALIQRIAQSRPGPVRVMTHCNAGVLATCGWGTALAPIYVAHAAGIPLQVWVSETRPRNQGLLTAWELARSGVPHTLIADNAAGHLMQQAAVDLVIVGADRIAANGDTANKIGTWLKALAAQACKLPFYIAAPLSTIDPDCPDGDAIPIEERSADELRYVLGMDAAGTPGRLCQTPGECANPAFDVTPATQIRGIITERGIYAPGEICEALR